MKKFVILLFVAMAALSAKAQVYVGGTVGQRIFLVGKLSFKRIA